MHQEQQGSRGVNTFTNYHNAPGMGPRIEAGAWVAVSCKVHDPTITSANPDGYWYRIASSPWNDQYYAPANTFMNGDPWGGPYTHNTDLTSQTAEPLRSLRLLRPQGVTLAQGPAAPKGFRYAITLTNFPANSNVSISCHDSVSPNGFYTFSLATNGSGAANTASCQHS